jgi:DNA-directed RNA polymerase specialized sigma24 family protein
MLKKDYALLKNKPLNVYSLYDEYAGMLLGYLIGVVKSKALAEDYLVKTFNSLSQNYTDINWDETSKWCCLQRFAKNELLSYHPTSNNSEASAEIKNVNGGSHNKYLDKMTEEQRLVFNCIYCNKKTVAQLSEEINKPEYLIKKLLKEAFAIIRGAHER